mgnify:CR=1 FL=1
MGKNELRSIINQYTEKADNNVLRIVKAVFETYEENEVNTELQDSEVFDSLIKKGIEDSNAKRIRAHDDVMADVRKRYNIE